MIQKTMLLDRTAWDVVLDAQGNWAIADMPYSLAQDVACAIKTFSGECWYDTTLGIPYWQDILGGLPPLPLIGEKCRQAALRVNGVADAVVTFTKFEDRTLSGYCLITALNGEKTFLDIKDMQL